MNPNVENRLREEIAAYNKLLPELMQHHSGKFVIFYEGTLRGAFDTFDAAGREAIRQFGDGPYLIRQVGAERVIPLPASVAFRPINASN